jgi:hypothetical protein
VYLDPGTERVDVRGEREPLLAPSRRSQGARTRDARNVARYLNDETLEWWGAEAAVHHGPHTGPVWGNNEVVVDKPLFDRAPGPQHPSRANAGGRDSHLHLSAAFSTRRPLIRHSEVIRTATADCAARAGSSGTLPG